MPGTSYQSRSTYSRSSSPSRPHMHQGLACLPCRIPPSGSSITDVDAMNDPRLRDTELATILADDHYLFMLPFRIRHFLTDLIQPIGGLKNWSIIHGAMPKKKEASPMKEPLPFLGISHLDSTPTRSGAPGGTVMLSPNYGIISRMRSCSCQPRSPAHQLWLPRMTTSSSLPG